MALVDLLLWLMLALFVDELVGLVTGLMRHYGDPWRHINECVLDDEGGNQHKGRALRKSFLGFDSLEVVTLD